MSKKKKPSRFPCTDAGNAELFADLYGGCVRFDHKQGRWLIWSEGQSRWTEDTTARHRVLMKNTARRRFKMAASLPNSSEPAIAERRRQAAWAIRSEGSYQIGAALKEAKSVEPICDDGEGWDAAPWLFGVRNGIVDLRTGKLRQGGQQDRITKFSPVAFDPAAKCPRFEQFLDEVFLGDSDLIAYVQKAAGYSLTGSTQEQCLLACYGEGSNGKTTFLEVMLYVEGDYGLDLPFSVLEAKRYGSTPGEGVNLPGARFAKAVEVREGRRLDEARVKSWTGGDTITVRPLYTNSFSFHPTHKLWLAFNHKPEIADDSPAMWRRVRLIPFDHTFDSQQADKGLLDKLKSEASGILNWAIAGCLAWQNDGLKSPAAVEAATSEYQEESDPLAPFFEDCCEPDISYSVTKGELLSAYWNWCTANKGRPVSRNNFYRAMKGRGFSEGSTGSVRYWTGLRLRPVDTTDATDPHSQKLSYRESSIEKSPKEGLVVSVTSASELPSLAKFAPVED